MRSQLRSYLRSLLQRKAVESDMDAEMRTHIELRAADLEHEGLAPTEALRRARIEFGGVEQHKEHMRASLGLRLLDELRADLRYAWRMLRRSPGFTAVAVGSLALGIGANTTIFTLTKSVLLDRLVVPHPEQLKVIANIPNRKSPGYGTWNGQVSTKDGRMASASYSYPIYRQMMEQNRTDANSPLEDLFGFQSAGNITINVDGHADVVNAIMVTGNFYQQMGVRPALGRAMCRAVRQWR